MDGTLTREMYDIIFTQVTDKDNKLMYADENLTNDIAGHFYQISPTSNTTVLSSVTPLPNQSHLAHNENIFAGVFVSLTTLAGIIENGIVVIVYRRTKRLQTSTNLFLLSMCVCNLVEAALSFPLMASSSFAQRWLFSKIGCQIYAFIIFSLGLTGIFHLVIVAVDRYLVICKDTKVKKGSAIKGSIACWLSGILWATLPFLGWNGYIFERAHLSCCINWYSKDPRDLSYIVTIMVFCLFVPMAVMSFTYGRIYITIKNSHQPSASTGKNSSGKFSRRKRKRQTKMLKMIIAMTVAFLLSWSPYAIVSLWAAFDDLRHIPPTSDVIPALLAKASVIWNPIIYVAMNQQFREGFLQFIGRDIGRRQHVAAATRSSRPRPTILNSNGQSTTISC